MPATAVPEWDAWDASGVELPDKVANAIGSLRHAEKVYADLPRPDQPRTASRYIAEGLDATDAVERANLDRYERGGLIAKRDAARAAIVSARAGAARATAAHREQLIAAAAPKVDALLEEAVPPVAGLTGPDGTIPDVEQIARTGTAKQLDAWRRLDTLHHELARIRSAWFTSWYAATAKVGEMRDANRAPGAHKPQRPGGYHVWRTPSAVTDIAVRHGTRTHLANIAQHHEAGHYRLAGLAELTQIVESRPVVHPFHGRQYLGVYVDQEQPRTRPAPPRPTPSASFL